MVHNNGEKFDTVTCSVGDYIRLRAGTRPSLGYIWAAPTLEQHHHESISLTGTDTEEARSAIGPILNMIYYIDC